MYRYQIGFNPQLRAYVVVDTLTGRKVRAFPLTQHWAAEALALQMNLGPTGGIVNPRGACKSGVHHCTPACSGPTSARKNGKRAKRTKIRRNGMASRYAGEHAYTDQGRLAYQRVQAAIQSLLAVDGLFSRMSAEMPDDFVRRQFNQKAHLAADAMDAAVQKAWAAIEFFDEWTS